MGLVLRIALLAVGIGLSAWLFLVAYDVGTDYHRFTRLRSRRGIDRTGRTPVPSPEREREVANG